MQRSLVGGRALLVNAIYEWAATFNRSLGIRFSPLCVSTLILQLSELGGCCTNNQRATAVTALPWLRSAAIPASAL